MSLPVPVPSNPVLVGRVYSVVVVYMHLEALVVVLVWNPIESEC